MSLCWQIQVAITLTFSLLLPTFANAANTSPQLVITSINTPKMQVVAPGNERGAALAVLADGRLLLGGGKNGSNLYLYDLKKQSEQLLGQVITSSERLDDARFAITDIAILSQDGNNLRVLTSYPQYNKVSKCVSVVLAEYGLTLSDKPILKRSKVWFKSKPCVPVSAVQHAAGRLEVIDKNTAYLTIGDLGFSKIGNTKIRADLGSVFKVAATKVEKISSGHRNQQGILLIGSDLYISEHGPRGGDELNLIKTGKDYGWPTVTYGQEYSPGDYVRPTRSGTHDGFEKPIYNWVPSVAPTELIQLPSSGWGEWSSQIVMATLKENALIFISLTDKDKVSQVVNVDVGERVRDLDLTKEGSIIATTDSGKLLIISSQA